MQDAISSRVEQIIADVVGVPRHTITEETIFRDVPSWDSLSHLKLVMAVESEFGVQVLPDEAVEFASVKDISRILSRKGSIQSK
jgi:acyl carrier protein